jgi:lysozyme family protein
MATYSDFLLAFELLVGHEGGWDNNPQDRGNWTSGTIGVGELKGTKYGIAAHAYPTLDIKNLTLEEARVIYDRDYWRPAGCPDFPPRLALIMFDCAVNNGVGRAVRFLQGAVGSGQDGAYGPNTKAAVERALVKDPDDMDLVSEVHAQRLHFMAGLDTWKTFGLGWSRRLAKVALQAGHHWPATTTA